MGVPGGLMLLLRKKYLNNGLYEQHNLASKQILIIPIIYLFKVLYLKLNTFK